MIRGFPKGMHPMTQLSSAILALQTDSVFAREYAKGTHKSLYWDHSYEDMLNLVARLPEVRARRAAPPARRADPPCAPPSRRPRAARAVATSAPAPGAAGGRAHLPVHVL